MKSAIALSLVMATLLLTACGKSESAPAAGPGPTAPPASAAIPSGGTTPSHEAVRAQALRKMSDLVSTLQSVKDEASAKDAVPKLEAIGNDFTALKSQDDKLPKMSDDEETALMNRLKPQAQPVLDGISAEMKRITALPPAVSAPVLAAMKSLDEKMP